MPRISPIVLGAGVTKLENLDLILWRFCFFIGLLNLGTILCFGTIFGLGFFIDFTSLNVCLLVSTYS